MTNLLVVAGEASGDRAAAHVIQALHGLGSGDGGARAFGMGGAALAASGVELLADLRNFTALGLGEVAVRAVPIALAHARLVREARARKPRAALLVNYTEFNTLLASRLHADGVRVLWYVAPQVWAWRPDRMRTLRRSVDRMAVILPFEEALWRSHGIDAHYVGHPAREATAMDRPTARAALGLTPYAAAIAIMPGSRPHEVKALLPVMLEAYERVRHDRASIDGRVLLAPSLDRVTRARALALARKHRVDVFHVDPHTGATPVLAAFDVALCASGTASLEATLARAVPVVIYRTGLLTEVAARALLRTKRIALPNVLLGRDAFAELVQRDVRTDRLALALAKALDQRGTLLAACDEIEGLLGPQRATSRLVARMLEPWLRAQA
jgi:lipid-A-disaccharide synthase